MAENKISPEYVFEIMRVIDNLKHFKQTEYEKSVTTQIIGNIKNIVGFELDRSLNLVAENINTSLNTLADDICNKNNP